MKPASQRLTTGQALVQFLAAQRVERDGEERDFFGPVLGIFGHGNLGGIGEALETYRDRVRFIPFRNEQAMAHAAAGYAWRRRRLGALACTTSVGPGATNLVTGAAGATINRLPVLLLPGDVFAGRHVRPLLQELEVAGGQDVTVNDALRPVSRYWDRITRPGQLLASLPEAMRVLTSPAETGAVTVCLPQDVQAEAFDWPAEFLEPRVWRVARAEPAPEPLAQAARLITSARRPMIVCGGGVRYSAAEDELAAFAAERDIPVAHTQAGKSTLAWDHPMNLGALGATGGRAANEYAADADLVICIGTRLGDFVTASLTAWQNPQVRFVGINVSEADARKQGALAVVADARQALRALGRELAGAPGDAPRRRVVERLRRRWNGEVERLATADRSASGTPTQAQVIGAVNTALAEGGTVVNAAGSMPGDLHKLWRSNARDDYNVEYGYSCMGYEIPGGLGIKLADPARPVVVLVGDGSYLMLNSEIVTSVAEGLPLAIVLVDTHGYRSISRLAASMGARNNFNVLRRRDADGRLGEATVPVDYASHASSMGAAAVRVGTHAELQDALAKALAAPRTTVIVVEIDETGKVPDFGWWDVPVAEISASPSVRRARKAYERARQAQRWRA